MPLSHPPAWAHHGGMTTAPCPTDALTVERFVLRNDRGLRRPLGALFAPTLDRQLASGCPPESSALLAARAAQLVSAPKRRKLVREWQRVLDQARRPPRARNPHAPLCRDRIIDVAGEVRALLGALATPLPVPARGVAMAGRLLSDGTGPLYNRNCPVRLSDALAEVIAELDPAFSRRGAQPAGCRTT
jgi:hypothetical protein